MSAVNGAPQGDRLYETALVVALSEQNATIGGPVK